MRRGGWIITNYLSSVIGQLLQQTQTETELDMYRQFSFRINEILLKSRDPLAICRQAIVIAVSSEIFHKMQSEIDATLQRINNHKGVLGTVIVDKEGQVLKTNLPQEQANQYANLIPGLNLLARNMVRDLDPQNDLEFLRIRSEKNEIMVAPYADFSLIVIQYPVQEG
eukprot:TRINITY_DN4438_c0_g1_i1.p3 TRINITY_DN4438_c0_g1~~TRINITY_DN4438_c0_g1_i1.p3  ORF type:complete len:168 (-),score=3.02 TRINITY_DN4438_c0_g1_i1:207-710(-)